MSAAEAERIRLEASWKSRLLDYMLSPAMHALRLFLIAERASGRTLYPPWAQIFAALDATPFEQVKVVLLGQDPYIGPGQAHGLSFSVPPGTPHPPSLRNMFKELEQDLAIAVPETGYLVPWAKQGVLLLNSVLTVQAGASGSHQGRGWEGFTDQIVDLLNREREQLVFLLWGSYAQTKGRLIDRTRHCILRAPHPSPLSANRGFFGCRHFSKCNSYLAMTGQTPIDWRIG